LRRKHQHRGANICAGGSLCAEIALEGKSEENIIKSTNIGRTQAKKSKSLKYKQACEQENMHQAHLSGGAAGLAKQQARHFTPL